MANFYANISTNRTNGHLGTIADPFSALDLTSHSDANPSGNVYFIKGTYISLNVEGESGPNFIESFYVNDNVWQGWDLPINGPWRIRQETPSTFRTWHGTGQGEVKDLLIADEGKTRFGAGGGETPSNFKSLSDSIVMSTSVISAAFCDSSTEVKGCIIRSLAHSESAIFQDCAFFDSFVDGGEAGSSTFTNCAFKTTVGFPETFTYIDCQESWTPPDPLPAWDDTEGWDLDVLLADIIEPPQPGYGDPSYTGYETDMWGNARIGIGAGHQGIPIASFSYTYSPGSDNVQFTDESLFQVTFWSWDFGDGETSTDQSPLHSYSSSGIYTVILTVANSYGPAIYTHDIYVNVIPVASFDYFVDETTNAVSFTDTSLGDPIDWAWDFGDYSGDTEQNPTHTYSTPGTYIVSLEVYNASEEYDTYTTTINVHYDPTPTGAGPEITSTPSDRAVIGEEYTYAPTATGTIDLWSLTGAPEGMAFDVFTGAISWTPTQDQYTSGPLHLTVYGDGGTDTQDWTILIAPVIITTPILTAYKKLLYTYGASATGPIDQWTLSGAPENMQFDTAQGRISWVPSKDQSSSGPLDLTVIATNGLEATQSFTVSAVVTPATYEVLQPGGALMTDSAGRRYRKNHIRVLESSTNLLVREYHQYDYNV